MALTVYKKPQPRGFDTGNYYIEDTSATSPLYFNLVTFPTSIGGGRSLIVLKGNGDNLRLNSTIDVEMIDAQGNNMYVDFTGFVDRFNNYYLTIEVYDITAKGPATVYLVGEALYDLPAYDRQIKELEEELQVASEELRVLQNRYNTANNNLSNATTIINNLRNLIDEDSAAITRVRGFLQAVINTIQGIPQNLIPQAAKEKIAKFTAEIQSFSNRLADSNSRLPGFVNKAAEEQRAVDQALARVQSATNTIRRLQQEISSLEPQELPAPTASQRPRHNVRWTGQVEVLPFERNNADLQFDKSPQISIAQIQTPARVQTQSTASGGYNYAVVTSSNNHTIETSNFQGYDRDFSTSTEIRDPRLQQILINAKQLPSTANSVNTFQRELDTDIQSGYLLNQSKRYGTVVTSQTSFFRKEFLGGIYTFYDTTVAPTINKLSPVIPSQSYTLSGSLSAQLFEYSPNIVEVVNDKQIIVDKAPSVKVIPNNAINRASVSTFTYKRVQPGFTASVTYGASDLTYEESTSLTQSYLEFTFQDLNPISGEIYRIKTFTKLQTLTGEYKLLNDQIVSPPEYLTDASYPNVTSYGKSIADYLLIGHFTSGSLTTGDTILNTYWDFVSETPSLFSPAASEYNNSVLIESAKLNAAATQSTCLTTKNSQNYSTDQRYTIGFYCSLDPHTELEIYMTSDPLNSYITPPVVFARAFNKSENKERNRDIGARSKFGKYIGKITNNRNVRKYYGKVLFDFETDGNGLGRPVFRSRVINESAGVSGSAYVSEIGIKPYQLNGFTPKLVQFPVPLNAEVVEALEVSQSIDFKIEYFDYTGRQSEYVTYLDDIIVNAKVEVPGTGCQTEKFQSVGFYSSFFI